MARKQQQNGRWPANLLLDEAAAEMLGEQSGVRPSGGSGQGHPSNGSMFVGTGGKARDISDTGTAARFFYTAKSARAERDMGLPEGKRSNHPTVKPLDLCRYLATLLRPPEPYLDEARLLVPYAGSGSEMIGAMLAGWHNVTGIEIEAEYLNIARARIIWWQWAYTETGLTDPKEIIAAMKRRKPTPLLEGMMEGR